jgi:hypothetical protein
VSGADPRYPKRLLAVRGRLVGGRIVVARDPEAFALSELGGVIWGRSDGRRTVDEVVEAIVAEYAGDPNVVRDDVVAFVEEMVADGYMEWAGAKSPGRATPFASEGA